MALPVAQLGHMASINLPTSIPNRERPSIWEQAAASMLTQMATQGAGNLLARDFTDVAQEIDPEAVLGERPGFLGRAINGPNMDRGDFRDFKQAQHNQAQFEKNFGIADRNATVNEDLAQAAATQTEVDNSFRALTLGQREQMNQHSIFIDNESLGLNKQRVGFEGDRVEQEAAKFKWAQAQQDIENQINAFNQGLDARADARADMLVNSQVPGIDASTHQTNVVTGKIEAERAAALAQAKRFADMGLTVEGEDVEGGGFLNTLGRHLLENNPGTLMGQGAGHFVNLIDPFLGNTPAAAIEEAKGFETSSDLLEQIEATQGSVSPGAPTANVVIEPEPQFRESFLRQLAKTPQHPSGLVNAPFNPFAQISKLGGQGVEMDAPAQAPLPGMEDPYGGAMQHIIMQMNEPSIDPRTRMQLEHQLAILQSLSAQ